PPLRGQLDRFLGIFDRQTRVADLGVRVVSQDLGQAVMQVAALRRSALGFYLGGLAIQSDRFLELASFQECLGERAVYRDVLRTDGQRGSVESDRFLELGSCQKCPGERAVCLNVLRTDGQCSCVETNRLVAIFLTSNS